MIFYFLFSIVNSLQFGYESERGQQICFSDNFSIEDVFDLRVKANSSNYALKISEAEKKSYEILYERQGSWEHNYQHQTHYSASQIRYCLTNLENDMITYNITYKTGSELADMQKVAKISDLAQMNQPIEKLNSLLGDIKRERSFLISKYDMMSQIQGSISKKQIAFGLFCLGISMIITFITVNMIKRIIRQKKVL